MRKAFVMLLTEEEHNPETLYEKLLVVKSFLELPANNKYCTRVHLDPEAWDLTPPEGDLPRLDNILQYQEIVKVVQTLFAGVDHTWYENNADAAWAYFHEGHVPYQAMVELGFPDDQVLPGTVPHGENVAFASPP